jgi:cell fate (sporulation/competence/biofilm development) regulator YlbF (YheA/YmcA/DUF963 family)
MEFKETIKNFFEQRKAEIKKEIQEKKENAILRDDYKNLRSELNLLRKKGSQITQEDIDRAKGLSQLMDEHAVKLKSLPELQYALEQIDIPKERFLHLLEHENAHANKAESMGTEVRSYVLALLKDNAEKSKFIVSTRIRFPKKLIGEERQIAKKTIAFAPEEYGNRLSKSDKEKYNELDLNEETIKLYDKS